MKQLQVFFSHIFMILVHPVRFFREQPAPTGLSGPLSLALICHWIGTAVNHLGSILFESHHESHWLTTLRRAWNSSEIDSASRSLYWEQLTDQISRWFFSTASVIADPFFTLLALLFTSFLVYLGARILVTPGKEGHPSEISFESAVRIVSYGTVPSLLLMIPLIGDFLSPFYCWIITLLAARETYRISTSRAIVISLFPKLLFIGIIGGGLFLMVITLFQIMT